jgi:hypothetical protein
LYISSALYQIRMDLWTAFMKNEWGLRSIV